VVSDVVDHQLEHFRVPVDEDLIGDGHLLLREYLLELRAVDFRQGPLSRIEVLVPDL